MATIKIQKQFYCYEECSMNGCNSHTAELTFQSVSNYYKFDNGNGKTIQFEQGELQALTDLLFELYKRRGGDLETAGDSVSFLNYLKQTI